MENKILSHEELLKNNQELGNNYLYHEGYVYYYANYSGSGRDATGWVGKSTVYKRAKDDGTNITVFMKTYNTDVTTASTSGSYNYSKPIFEDGYVYFRIGCNGSNDVEGDYYYSREYRVKSDGISDLEYYEHT